MKLRVAFCAFTILLAPAVLAKTKFMVEDPNNVVVGRYGITTSQAEAAAEIAETFLTSGRLEAVQKAYVVRYIGVDAGPLTAEQASKEPSSIAKAARRLGRYGVAYDGNQLTRVIAIYDAIRHRGDPWPALHGDRDTSPLRSHAHGRRAGHVCRFFWGRRKRLASPVSFHGCRHRSRCRPLSASSRCRDAAAGRQRSMAWACRTASSADGKLLCFPVLEMKPRSIGS